MNSNLDKVFEQIDDAVKGMKLPMKDIGTVILASITKNFRVGGRYNPSLTGDELLRGGGSHWVGGSHLTKSSRLRSAVAVNINGLKIDLSVLVAYAAAHQYGVEIKHPGGTPYIPWNSVNGAKKKKGRIGSMGQNQMVFLKKDGNYPAGVKFTRPHVIGIPARPYIVIQAEDLIDIADLIAGRALL